MTHAAHYDLGSERLARMLVDEGITSPRVLEAFRRVQRESFVPLEGGALAYRDVAVPIAHEQVTTQPSLVARMVEALDLGGGEKVLEIGTGLGFQTAILASLCREVYSVEWYADLAEQARRNLEAAGIHNVHVIVGDGTQGLAEHAPYDAIVTCAAAERVPPPLAHQLGEGGVLVHPLGPGGDEEVLAYRKHHGALVVERLVTRAFFVQMVGAFGAAGARPD